MKFIKWLLELFKIGTQKDEVSTPPIINQEIPTKEDIRQFPKKKIAIIVGHGNGDGGADTWNGSNEFEYNSLVAEYVKNESSQLIETFYRTSSGIVGVAAEAVAWKPDICIELHLNSYNGLAKGCEVLVLEGDKESERLARNFAVSFALKFQRVVRGDKGVKWIGNRDRGAASLRALSPIKQSILIEPMFCDNKLEWIEPNMYAKFLTKWINEL
jgi:N-acetylmuramoyl-L-alanine amidase